MSLTASRLFASLLSVSLVAVRCRSASAPVLGTVFSHYSLQFGREDFLLHLHRPKGFDRARVLHAHCHTSLLRQRQTQDTRQQPFLKQRLSCHLVLGSKTELNPIEPQLTTVLYRRKSTWVISKVQPNHCWGSEVISGCMPLTSPEDHATLKQGLLALPHELLKIMLSSLHQHVHALRLHTARA